MIHRTSDVWSRFLAVALPGSALVAGLSGTAHAGTTSTSGAIPSALVITKSSNKNQVNYAIDVDGGCAPTGAAPVHPYWRMLEHGTGATEPLRGPELRAFGVERQAIGANFVQVALRGMPARAITIRTWRTPSGACQATADTTIAGVPARISNVHVQEKLFGVAYVQLTGWSDTGAVVSERIAH
jgi:hypothetical protein